jgi:hypothetical protein
MSQYDDLADLVFNNDQEALNKIIEERASQIASRIAAEQVQGVVRQITETNEVIAKYPELRNPDSALARETTRQLEVMSHDPRYAGLSNRDLLDFAALSAQADILRREQPPRPKPEQVKAQAQAQVEDAELKRVADAYGITVEDIKKRQETVQRMPHLF